VKGLPLSSCLAVERCSAVFLKGAHEPAIALSCNSPGSHAGRQLPTVAEHEYKYHLCFQLLWGDVLL